MVFECPIGVVNQLVRKKKSIRHIPLRDISKNKKLNCKYKQEATGSFNCNECKRGWDSYAVTVTMKFSTDKTIFQIQMYGQQCKKCVGVFCKPKIVKSEWKRLEDKFLSVLTEKPKKSEAQQLPSRGLSNKPHQSSMCEACHKNECNKTK